MDWVPFNERALYHRQYVQSGKLSIAVIFQILRVSASSYLGNLSTIVRTHPLSSVSVAWVQTLGRTMAILYAPLRSEELDSCNGTYHHLCRYGACLT